LSLSGAATLQEQSLHRSTATPFTGAQESSSHLSILSFSIQRDGGFDFQQLSMQWLAIDGFLGDGGLAEQELIVASLD